MIDSQSSTLHQENRDSWDFMSLRVERRKELFR